MAVLLILNVFLMLMGSVAAFRPVILMHGILSSAKHMEHLASFIKRAHPGTVVMNVDIFSNLESGAPMWQQLLTLEDTVRPLMKKHPEGVNMVCFSQGMHINGSSVKCVLKLLLHFVTGCRPAKMSVPQC